MFQSAVLQAESLIGSAIKPKATKPDENPAAETQQGAAIPQQKVPEPVSKQKAEQAQKRVDDIRQVRGEQKSKRQLYFEALRSASAAGDTILTAKGQDITKMTKNKAGDALYKLSPAERAALLKKYGGDK